MKNNHSIIKATYPKKGTIVYLFYEIVSGKYSGHFFENNVLSLEKTTRMIAETFPPTFEEIGEYKVRLNPAVEYLYMKPDLLPTHKYSFFENLKNL